VQYQELLVHLVVIYLLTLVMVQQQLLMVAEHGLISMVQAQ
jgi:hypothetical protein